jgi:DNA-binding GntR family transcriptional regulator
MGVSRSPVREAARSLVLDGLVTTVANRGVFVRTLSVDEIRELYDLRAMIAGYLCARAAERAGVSLKTTLRLAVAEMALAAAAGDEAAYFALNLDFHDRIAEAAGAGRARRLYASMGKEVRLMRLRVLKGQASLMLSNAEHDGIVRAVETGDAMAAREAAAAHHLNGMVRLMETLRR